MKKLISLLSLTILLSACAPASTPSDDEFTIAASFYPLAEMARNVAGDHAEVITITPAGSDPHEYEPSPKDIAAISESDLFIFNGAGQDPWAEKLELENTAIIHMTENFSLLEGEDHDHEEEGEDHDHEEEGEDHDHEEEEGHHHEFDPHIWLDPTQAAQEVEIIAEKMIEVDPQNAAIYQANADAYKQELLQLDSEYKETLVSCQKDSIITAHAAFGYMAARYGFNQIAIAGLSPEQEPSARKLAEIADLAEEEDIKYIFFETLTSPRISETLAQEVGAQTLLLDPVEGLTQEQIAAGENYVTVMRSNLKNLAIALECE
ncbi:MAG: zinc ABC transporter substrate-binding protein [Candidatus Gracilibacteria bacterium]|nr:zinc ABC transporter substrate-binding protein [Candidatus Peregrinibacteria bacterium]